jgi:hypothetical protein
MQTKKRWAAVALLAAGIAIGVVMVATPAGAHVGGSVNHLWNHLKPKADKRYLPGPPMQKGTVRGMFLVGGTAGGAGEIFLGDIAYGWSMPSALTEHYIEAGDPNPAGCTGTVALPTAAPGHLCVYEQAGINAGTRNVEALAGGRYGTRLFVNSAGAGQTEIRGTWVARAPLPGTPRPVPSRASLRPTGS